MARVGGVYLLAGTSLSGPARVGWFAMTSAVAFASPQRIGAHYMWSPVGMAGPMRVGAVYKLSVQSVTRAFDLLRLDGGQLYDQFQFDYTLSPTIIPEHNPYRPRIPEQLIHIGEDYYDFSEENQQILREQHNITQAGDTTFPYQLVEQGHDNKLYKLGSIGRFYHEFFGVILARYVQFDEMAPVELASCPVGLFKKATNLDWIVTNNLELSDPDLVVGISAPFAIPVDKQYGWVIVNGANLQPVKNSSDSAEISEAFSWDATGSVSNNSDGKILGRRVNKLEADSTAILQGQMWIHLESMSEAKVNALVDAKLAELQSDLSALQGIIDELPDAQAVANISARITAIANQLTIESDARKAVDLAIQDQLAHLGGGTNSDITQNDLTTAIAAIQTQLDEIRAIAVDALAKANQSLSNDVNELQAQIALILDRLAFEIDRPKGKFPVVDGSIPPNLVYLDDGSLVYVETF